MLHNDITKETVLQLETQFKSLLDGSDKANRQLFEQGYQLYRDGNIYNTKVEDNKLSATVFDEHQVAVRLDLLYLQHSHCSEHPGLAALCEHNIAAFLYVYSSFASVGDFIDAWKGTTQKRKVNRKKQEVQLPTLPKAHFPEPSIAQWLESFEEIYETFLKRTDRNMAGIDLYLKHRMMPEQIGNRYFNMLLNAKPNDIQLQRVYTVLAGVVTIDKVNRYSTHHLDDDKAIPSLQELVALLEQTIVPMRNAPLTEKQRTLVEDSIPHFDVLLHVTPKLQPVSMLLYRVIWSTLLFNKDWIIAQDKELAERLDSLQDAGTKQSPFGLSLLIARMHFAFLLARDDEAIAFANQLSVTYVDQFMYMVEATHEYKQKDRLLTWLNYTKHRLLPSLQQEGHYRWKRMMTDSLLYYYEIYSDYVDSDTVYVEALQDMLPYSFYTFNEYLLDHEDYERWAELQLIVGFQPEMHSRQLLRKIELTNRNWLLPLYHQAVQRAIAEKNRQAYKLAVRRLRKLRTHYRQLKKVNKWEQYIAFIIKKHRRLRAFQDELQKGKLV